MKLEIIAELAQGFEGRPELARLLLKAASTAGADAAKYQLVFADELATPDYKHYALFRSLEMADASWAALAESAEEWGIQLHLDIFGRRSLELAETIGVGAIKLHGTDIANVGLLQAVAASSVPRVLLGAGGAHLTELASALRLLAAKPVVVLLGFQGYPTPNGANQIARLGEIVEKLPAWHAQALVGFADHAPPDTPLRHALAATALGAGARVIEKHLTLGMVMKLEDHESALNPDDFSEFVRILRSCEEALGTSRAADDFGMDEAEQKYRTMIRRHVVAARDLKRGVLLTPADLMLKRTSAEKPLTDPGAAYGRKLMRDLLRDAPVLPADLEQANGGSR